jgi:hypothetical protein
MAAILSDPVPLTAAIPGMGSSKNRWECFMHRARFRRFASLTLATTVVGVGVSVGGTTATAASSRVTFSSVPATAPLVTHYTVNPTAPPPAAFSTLLAKPMPRSGAGELGARRTTAAAKLAATAQATAPAVAAAPATGTTTVRTPTTASFAGMQSSKSICPPVGCNPPDMAVAASTQWVFQGVNTSFEVLDTHGHVQPGWPVNAQTFFGVPNLPGNCDPAGPFLSDPRAFYDPSTGRFWAAALQVENAFGVAPDCPFQSSYYLAVSQTGDPRGSWNVYQFEMSLGTTNAADYTMIGFGPDAVYFSANMFNNAGSAYEYAEIFEANKALMQAGSGGFTAAGFTSLTASGPGGNYLADTVQPALTLNARGSGETFVDTINGLDPVTGNQCFSAADACRGLAVWHLGNPVAHDTGGPAPTLTGQYVPNTLPYYYPPSATQPGCTQCIDTLDVRISATPVVRDGTLYAAWDTGIDNGSGVVPGIEYAQVSLGQNGNRQDGQGQSGQGDGAARTSYYYFDGDTGVSFPAVMPDGSGNVVMLYERMGSTINPETRVVATDNARFTGPGRLLKAGEAPYRPGVCGTAVLPVCRWGDFSASSSDGHGGIWLAGEYANGNVGPSTDPNFSSRNWGTWISKVSTH